MVIVMSMGIVFSIEEFSVYDGPGIRTTVFLKGCPLRCKWCHNPEGQERFPQYIRSANGCIGCKRCVQKGLEIYGKPFPVKESISVCPKRLIRKCGEEYTSEELVDILCKNADMLSASGGGVTFSGGEPLFQSDFLINCLKNLNKKMNRAIQTTGYADKKIFEAVLENCDYVLYDIKLIDEGAHRYYTGASNGIILENFKTLVQSEKPFCVRMPLIPNVTDTVENIEKASNFLKENGVDSIELLPYNKAAGGKYFSLGKEYKPDFDEKTDVKIRYDIFEKYGIEVKVL